jgi:hypothetical protein
MTPVSNLIEGSEKFCENSELWVSAETSPDQSYWCFTVIIWSWMNPNIVSLETHLSRILIVVAVLLMNRSFIGKGLN